MFDLHRKRRRSTASATLGSSNSLDLSSRRQVSSQHQDVVLAEKQPENKVNEHETAHESNNNTELLLQEVVGNIVTPSMFYSSGILSPVLKVFNQQVWCQLLSILKKRESTAIVLSGPTGSGKTFGIKECASIVGMKVFEIEPSCLSSTEDLKKWLTNIGSAKTLLGPRLILVDAIEGIDAVYMRYFHDYLKKSSNSSAPIVFVCDDVYNMQLRGLVSKIRIQLRLSKPSKFACTQLAKLTFAKAVPIQRIQQHAEYCDGDYRRLNNSLKREFFDDIDERVSVFKTTTNLINGRCSIDDWERCGSQQTLEHIFFDNYIRMLDDKHTHTHDKQDTHDTENMLQNLQEFADTLSFLSTQCHSESHNCIMAFKLRQLPSKEFMRFTLQPSSTQRKLKPPVNRTEYQSLSSRLYIPELLINPETFYIGNNHI